MYGTRNQVVLPLNLETKIKGDDPVFKLAEYAKRAAEARIQCSNCCRKRVHCGRRTVPEPNRYAYADSVS